MTHPAPWNPAILVEIVDVLADLRLPVHDPFAGGGERLGEVCDRLGLRFTGTEIEAPFIVDRRVGHGNSTQPETYPPDEFVVVTSPVYPNGMTDHFASSVGDESLRHTYRHARAKITGEDRALHADNMGRWGNRYRRSEASERAHWDIANRCVRWWPEWAIVNCKDILASTYEYHVIDGWRRLLGFHGYMITDERVVSTPGQRHGANRDLRRDTESVLIARRSP